jgi:FlaG/FlaF family flagellin (archaellin)
MRADERGVSSVVGAILMFGLVLALLAVLQTTAVPALNAELELQHNERVEADVVTVGGAVDRVAATGRGESVVLETGLRYPPRMFFVNPPPVTGTLRTTDPATVEVANARAAGEAGDYWTGTARRFQTRSLVYAPAYNEYPNAPTTVHEGWAVYDRFDGTTRPLGDHGLVDGRRITLVTLDGRVAASARSVPLDVSPVSAPTRVVTVRDNGDPVTLTVPTGLTEDDWAALLEDELDLSADPGNDRYVTGLDCQRSPPAPCGRLTVTLEAGATYELRLGKVSLGSGADEPEATYLVDVAGDGTSVPEGGSRKLTVEVRDRFDNRVSGVAVDATIGGDGTLRATEAVSGDDGRAAFVYEAPDDVDGATDVTVTARFGDAPRETVTFDVRVTDADGSDGGGDGGGGGEAPTADVRDVTPRPGQGNDRYHVNVEVTDPDGDLDRVEFELRDPDSGTVIDTVNATVSGTNDTATERLRATGRDRQAEYRISVTVFDATGNTGSDETTVTGSG